MSPTATQPSWVVSGAGFATLNDPATRLLNLLDVTFCGWGRSAGAAELTLPPVLPVADLARLDVYQNFPHLAMVATTLEPERFTAIGNRPEEIAGADVRPARLGLPSAVCYGVYLHLAGQILDTDRLYTAVGTCYRNETHFDGLRRLGAFRMREVVALGSPEHAVGHLGHFSDLVLRFAGELDLPIAREAASDPFYDNTAPQALWQKIAPVKHEFVSDGLAIASVNEHRTFFGERCDIRLAGPGDTFSSSCAAFGLERWVAVLAGRYGGDLEAALAAVTRAAQAVAPAGESGPPAAEVAPRTNGDGARTAGRGPEAGEDGDAGPDAADHRNRKDLS